MEQAAATLPGSAKMPQIQSWIETFVHPNNQINMCTFMLSMFNYQSQVTAVSYSLMKTCIKDECKTYKMQSKWLLINLWNWKINNTIVLTLSTWNSGVNILLSDPNVSSEKHFTILVLLITIKLQFQLPCWVHVSQSRDFFTISKLVTRRIRETSY